MPSLADKLKSLGVKTGNTLQTPAKPESRSIDSVVAGSFFSTSRGEAFVSEQVYDSTYQHGNFPVLSSFPLSFISQWANDPRIDQLPITKYAFLDTETSGVSGGWRAR